MFPSSTPISTYIIYQDVSNRDLDHLLEKTKLVLDVERSSKTTNATAVQLQLTKVKR